MGWAMGGQPCF